MDVLLPEVLSFIIMDMFGVGKNEVYIVGFTQLFGSIIILLLTFIRPKLLCSLM